MATDRKFVKWSSPDSIAEEKISALAIVEVVLSVAAYCWIAVAYNTHLHILVSIIAAPLVLLRSEASVAAAEVLWDRGDREDEIKINSPLGWPSSLYRRSRLLLWRFFWRRSGSLIIRVGHCSGGPRWSAF